jgi:hypothetical protein
MTTTRDDPQTDYDSDDQPRFKKVTTWVQFYNNLFRLPRVTLSAGILFTLIGMISLYLGRQYYYIEQSRAFAWFVIGFVLFLPGIYAIAILLLVALQVEGYSLDDLPSYEEAVT